MNIQRPFRVLSLDGGGMRGIYTAQYLASLADGFSKKAGRKTLDVGSGFDLIVGTSTGAILACALVANIPLARVVQFYNQKGAAIFERRVPSGTTLGLGWRRSGYLDQVCLRLVMARLMSRRNVIG